MPGAFQDQQCRTGNGDRAVRARAATGRAGPGRRAPPVSAPRWRRNRGMTRRSSSRSDCRGWPRYRGCAPRPARPVRGWPPRRNTVSPPSTPALTRRRSPRPHRSRWGRVGGGIRRTTVGDRPRRWTWRPTSGDATRSGWSTPRMSPIPPDMDRQTICLARPMCRASRMPTASRGQIGERVARSPRRVAGGAAGVPVVVADHEPVAVGEPLAEFGVPPQHRGGRTVDEQDGRVRRVAERSRCTAARDRCRGAARHGTVDRSRE